MKDIKVVTDDGNAYYTIISRLKKTHLPFVGIPPSEVSGQIDAPIITTRKELHDIKGSILFAIEDLSENPLIMEGQILSSILHPAADRSLLIGIDPGSRTGVVIFYGERQLGAFTVNSVESLVEILLKVAEEVPNSGLTIKIGDGDPKSLTQAAHSLNEVLPLAIIEVVDETGTSGGRLGKGGAARDERAAAKIAHRKGNRFIETPSTRKNRM